MTTTQLEPSRINRKPVNPSNRFGLDYEQEAHRLGPPPTPMIDVHSHISGRRATDVFKRACDLYGIERIYSMTQPEAMDDVRTVLGERIRFIAVPNFHDHENRRHHFGEGYVDRIVSLAAQGVKIVKFWVAPRSIDYATELGDPGFLRLNGPAKIAAMQAASELGMIFMTHVADPDTWFATKYSDASVYGTKREQYIALEEMLERFRQPWIAAHMGGWPEDLEFLDGLLDRHPNLYLDTSATKWQVRELSKHSRDDLITFLRKFSGRILFGSDIVTTEQHLKRAPDADENEMTRKAGSEDEAFDLYASRYWALRTMFETDYAGESPIADPDLAMVDPANHDPFDAPPLSGKSLPADILRDIYHDAAANLLDPLHT